MKQVFFFLLLPAFLLLSCEKDETTGGGDSNLVVNTWIDEEMSDYYLWNRYLPYDPPSNEVDPEKYFYSLLYDEVDKWSYITDDYSALIADLSGEPLSTGYAPAFGKMKDSDNIFIVVKYVYEDSPADRAGVQRGDIITKINGMALNLNNYVDLGYAKDQSVEFADYVDGQFILNGEQTAMTSEVLMVNPVVYDTVFEIEQKKIGYFVLTEYIASERFVTHLSNTFTSFQSAQVDEVIIDLRYNGGGYLSSAQWLTSSLAPTTNVSANDLLVKLQYNDKIEPLLEDGQKEHRFEPTGFNFNLNRVFFMTASGSASASELSIVGLQPYMDVVVVGDTTYGKYTSSIVIPDSENPPRHDYAMMPIIAKYVNAVGFTDFGEGLVPTHWVDDRLLSAFPFGDINDPILAKTMEIITGVPAKKSTIVSTPYDRLFSPEELQKMHVLE